MTKDKPSFDVPCGHCGKVIQLLKDSTEDMPVFHGDCFAKLNKPIGGKK
tara:strand:+ start:10261 stop:10407 length:147 start_codon:yes stop_codon:yes gene_type:complete